MVLEMNRKGAKKYFYIWISVEMILVDIGNKLKYGGNIVDIWPAAEIWKNDIF